MVKFWVVLCLGVLASSGASACGILKKATPPVGSSTPAAAVHNITLSLSQRIKPDSATILISSAGGKVITTGKTVTSEDDTIIATSVPTLAAGKYKVTWTVVWLDCDSETQNHYGFTVTP